jgi:hypothetical protein
MEVRKSRHIRVACKGGGEGGEKNNTSSNSNMKVNLLLADAITARQEGQIV